MATSATATATSCGKDATPPTPPTKKHKKPEYLKYTGHRSPRVGDAFQATILPAPVQVAEEEAEPSGAAQIEQESE